MNSYPLTGENLVKLNAALQALDSADEVIARAKQAGLEVAEQETRSREYRGKILRIKQAFFPGQ